MKLLLHLFTAVVLVLCCSLPALANTLSVRADLWPPYNADPRSDKPGYMIEVLREIFEPQGIVVDYQLLPWPKAVSEVKTGRVAAIVGTDQEETPSLVFPKENLGIHVNGFFVRAGNPWRFSGIPSLRRVRLGVIEGYSYGALIDGYLAEPRGRNVSVVSGENPLGQLVALLAAGQIDVIVENINVMNYSRQALGAKGEKIEVAGFEFIDKSSLYVGFAPGIPQASEYAQRFDEGIVRLRKSGRLAQIMARYGLKDWK